MDIWEQLYEKAKAQYHPEEVTPFITAHHSDILKYFPSDRCRCAMAFFIA